MDKIIYDFDKWKILYKDDPEKFEELKNAYFIQSITEMCHGDEECIERAKKIHFNINLRLSRIKNPIARMAKLEQMLYDELLKLNDALNGVIEPQPDAKVLPFQIKPKN